MINSHRHHWVVLLAAALLFVACGGSDSGSSSLPATAIGGTLDCPSPVEIPVPLPAPEFRNPAAAEEVREKGDPNHLLFDSISNPSGEQTVSGVATYQVTLILNPLADEYVSIWTKDGDRWRRLARVLTDAEGRFKYTLTPEQALPTGAHEVYAIVEGDRTCAEGGLFVYPSGTKVVVSDIDETLTLSDAELLEQIVFPDYDQKMRPAADKVMQAYAEKGYEIVYVTARPFHFRMFTRTWLRAHAFPFGFLSTAEGLVEGDTARDYKAGFLNEIQADLGISIEYAYGNADSDIAAYAEAGIPLDRTFTIGELAGTFGTTPVTDGTYVDHLEVFLPTVPEADQPFQPSALH